jgi:subtilase family serine protease
VARVIRHYGLLLTLVTAVLLACAGTVLAQQNSPAENTSSEETTPDVGISPHLAKPGQSSDLCPKPAEAGKARCFAQKRNDIPKGSSVTPDVTPVGYKPSDLQHAYNLTGSASTNGSGRTVALVDAFHDPYATKDLKTYRSQFSLPSCTTANGCFKQVDQTGGTNYPSYNAGWAGEISLDLDMISAICPNCNILLVEADSNSFSDLAAAVDYAAGVPGVVAISNSYGGSEFSGESSLESHFNHPGKAITASNGDDGYGAQFPAASQFVTAVGGTHLTEDSSTRGWSESVWGHSSGGTGSGCSAYISKPSWQSDRKCINRTVGDVAAVADPNTGVAVYSTADGGWNQFGGTSASAPIIAAVYTLAENTSSINYGSYPYSHTSSLYDVTTGNNGKCSKKKYLCHGVSGYDGPTGNGTPNGTGAF